MQLDFILYKKVTLRCTYLSDLVGCIAERKREEEGTFLSLVMP